MNAFTKSPPDDRRPTPWVEYGLVACAVLLAAILGFANLGLPSLWHDELIHVLVARGIPHNGLPLLLSGRIFTEGTLYNYLLALVILLFGDGETAVRAPSVVFAGVNVVLTYCIVRRLLGGPAAVIAAFALALSPWNVAWSRQARFYMLQQTVFLCTLYALWQCTEARDTKGVVRWGAAFCAGYGLGLLSGPHSVFFLAPAGVYLGLRTLHARQLNSRWTVLLAVVIVLGVASILGYMHLLPKAEYDAIFKEANIGGKPPDIRDYDQSDRLYYFRFFTNNLSKGYFILACLGFGLMLNREGRRGLFAAVAFLAPILILNFLVGYRRHRFLFFAYPFYVAAFSYAIVQLAAFLPGARRSALRAGLSVLILVFFARLTGSTSRLLEDTLHVASGADATLAVVHPQWRRPCRYVRDHRDDAVVLCTTYVTAYYYVGHVDNWYPSRVVVWEHIESGLDGLKTLDDLKAYVREHPKGYFIAEYRRFHHWPFFAEDLAWVEQHMKRIGEASSDDVYVYSWGV